MLFKTFFTKPGALEMVVASAVMHANYAYQARSYIRALEDEIAYVEQIGEEAFNEHMVAQGPQGLDEVRQREASAASASPA